MRRTSQPGGVPPVASRNARVRVLATQGRAGRVSPCMCLGLIVGRPGQIWAKGLAEPLFVNVMAGDGLAGNHDEWNVPPIQLAQFGIGINVYCLNHQGQGYGQPIEHRLSRLTQTTVSARVQKNRDRQAQPHKNVAPVETGAFPYSLASLVAPLSGRVAGFFTVRFFLIGLRISASTSSITAIGALSPKRRPTLTMRVYPPARCL